MNYTIAHTISAHNVFGPEKTIINESLSLLKEKYKVVIILIHQKENFPLLDKVKQSNIPCYHLVSSCKFDFIALFKLKRLLLEIKCDLVHSHGYKADIISLIACKLLKISIITTIHGWTAEDFKVRIYEKMQAFFWNFFDLLLCVSDSYKKKALDLGIRKEKLKVVFNGIIVNDYNVSDSEILKSSFLTKCGIAPQHFLVGIIGRLSIEKGHKYFVEAAQKILEKEKDVSFVIIGDGVERKKIERLILKLNLCNQVYILGHIYNMKEVYAALDAIVIASLREGLPNVLLEGMLCGKPIVAANVGGIPEVIKNNENGFLVCPKHSAEIAHSLLTLIRKPKERQRLAVAGKETIVKNFTFEQRMGEIKRIYKKTIKNKKKKRSLL